MGARVTLKFRDVVNSTLYLRPKSGLSTVRRCSRSNLGATGAKLKLSGHQRRPMEIPSHPCVTERLPRMVKGGRVIIAAS